MTTQSNENAHGYLSEPRRSNIFGGQGGSRSLNVAPDLPVMCSRKLPDSAVNRAWRRCEGVRDDSTRPLGGARWRQEQTMMSGFRWPGGTRRAQPSCRAACKVPRGEDQRVEHAGDLVRVVRRLDGEPGRVGEHDLGHDADRCLQSRRLPALELEHLDVRVVDGIERLLCQRLLHDLRHHGLDDLFAQRGGTEPSFDQLTRRATGAKAFDPGARGEAVQHPVVGGVHHLRGHLDAHADLAFGQALGYDREFRHHRGNST